MALAVASSRPSSGYSRSVYLLPSAGRPVNGGPYDGRHDVVRLVGASFALWTAILTMVTAVGVLTYQLTRRELDLGYLGLAEFVPTLTLGLLSGSIADRYDRRRVAAGGMATLGAACAGMGVLALGTPSGVAPILAIMLVFGTGRALASPSMRALPADIVDDNAVAWLVARVAAVQQVAFIVGPVLAGTLYAVDPGLPFFVAAILAGIGAILMVTMHASGSDADAASAAPPVGVRARWADAIAGWRFIRQHPVLWGAVTLDLFAVLAGGAIALLPALALDQIGVGSVGLGWLRAAVGIGATAMVLFLARRPLTRHVGVYLLVSVAIFGAATFALGLSTTFAAAFIAVVVLSGADAVSMYIRSTMLPLMTPRNMRGRVLAVEMVFIGASNEIGAFESGLIGEYLGPARAVMLGGLVTVAVAIIWSRIFPDLRRQDRFVEQPVGD